MSDYVTFQLDGRAYATRIDSVREVVRMAELVALPGMMAPLAGVLDLRGVSLPVVDIRSATAERGDVLVLATDEAEYGFACDSVTAVVDRADLPAETSRVARSSALPGYVEHVLRGADGPVFLVDIGRMVGEGAVAALQSVPTSTDS